jgi:hypothetical protein
MKTCIDNKSIFLLAGIEQAELHKAHDEAKQIFTTAKCTYLLKIILAHGRVDHNYGEYFIDSHKTPIFLRDDFLTSYTIDNFPEIANLPDITIYQACTGYHIPDPPISPPPYSSNLVLNRVDKALFTQQQSSCTPPRTHDQTFH